MTFRCVFHCALVASFLWASTPSSRAEEWVSLESGQTIQAGFMGMWQENVVLRLSDGRRVVVPKAKLAAASRIQADELAAKQAERRKSRIDELSQSSSGGVVAKVEPAPDYVPLPESVSLKDYVEAFSKQLEAGHIRAIWDALPASYQNDVKDIMRTANQSGDEEQYAQGQRLMTQLGRTLLKQRDFVFNYPALSSVPPESKEIAEKVYVPAASIIRVLGNQEILSLEAFRNDNWEPMIAQLDQEMAPHIGQLIRLVPVEYNPLASLSSINPNSVEMQGDDRGSVSITNPEGQIRAMKFVLVEGKWLPEDLVNSWQDFVAETKQQLASQSQAAEQMSAISTAVTSFLGAALANIENAETQAEFNDTIDMYVETVMQLVGSQMASNGQAFGGPGMGGTGMGQAGMGGSSMMGGPGMTGPGMASPGMPSPGMAAPGMASPGMASPGMPSPGMAAPGMASPGMPSPGMAGPGAGGHGVGGPGAQGPGAQGHGPGGPGGR